MMKIVRRLLPLAFAIGPLLTFAAQPAMPPGFEVTPIATPPTDPSAIKLYPGVAPGSESAQQAEVWEMLHGRRIVRNVTQPLLIPVLPERSKATGQAVVVAPGGGFLMLSYDSEGLMAARRLAERGIAAFVLKYRLTETPPETDGFLKMWWGLLAQATKPGAEMPPLRAPLALADAQAAMRLVRARAAEWGVDSKKVGFLGFSAGAMTGIGLIKSDANGAMPDSAALVYGPMDAVPVPSAAPSLFVALAADDPLFGGKGFGLIDGWQKAGKNVELHYFEKGSHGFGMHTKGTTSDKWIDSYLNWLDKR